MIRIAITAAAFEVFEAAMPQWAAAMGVPSSGPEGICQLNPHPTLRNEFRI